MHDASIRRLRQAIRRVQRQRNPKRRRYGRALQRSATRHTLALRARGTSVRSTAAALGLPYKTLCLWLQGAAHGFRAVATKPAEAPAAGSELRLVTAQGHRVEGLGREDLVLLLRALS
jgi:hypothetical protein